MPLRDRLCGLKLLTVLSKASNNVLCCIPSFCSSSPVQCSSFIKIMAIVYEEHVESRIYFKDYFRKLKLTSYTEHERK